MLKKKIIRKLLITTITTCLLLSVYLMPNSLNKEEKLKTNIEVKQVQKVSKCKLYLPNNDNLLVRTTTLVFNNKDIENKIKDIISNLMTINDSIIPKGLNTIIPKNTKILGIKVDENIVYINFSKELLNIDSSLEETLIEAISYSILELKEINGVSIYVDGVNINGLLNIKVPSIITKDYGINKEYNLTSKNNIKKFVVYYIEELNNEKYYVPITKYVNDNRDKIKIIIENLSSNYIYEPNLVSYLTQNTELINYEINNDIMTLNFNNSVFMSDGKLLEEVTYPIMYSIFDNYNVKEVIIKAKDKEILKKTAKELE